MFVINALEFQEDRLFLLTHMRSCSTVLGHVLGSNPAINGYYEMRQNYKTVDDLVTQQQTYLENHTIKPNSKYIFDKVVFNRHRVHTNLLSEINAKVIISVGSPLDTIPSIMELKSNNKNALKLNTYLGAARFYKQRVTRLVKYARELHNQFIFVDANDIINKTQNLFAYLENELDLSAPLTAKYSTDVMSFVSGTGDPSDNLISGTIGTRRQHDLSQINMDSLQDLELWYQQKRAEIISHAIPNTYYDPSAS